MTTVSREQTQAGLDKLATGVMKHAPEESYSVADRFEKHARDIPDHTFLIFEGKTITYAELNQRANQYAGVAVRAGLVQGDVAAVMLSNRPEFFYAWLGLTKVGVIAALINTEARGRTLQHAISETKSKLLFVGEECAQQFQSVAGLAQQLKTYLVLDRGEAQTLNSIQDTKILSHCINDEDKANPPISKRSSIVGSDPLWYIFTSGTTGLPKAALLTHARWLGVGDGWSDFLNITADDVFYCMLPLFHGAASLSLVSNAVSAGASIVLRRKFSASNFWLDVREHGVTTAQYIGEICRYLVNRPPQDSDKDHTLKRLTGAGITKEVWTQFIERFGNVEILEGWGATESNCNLINLDQKIGSCGRIPFKDLSNGRLVKYNLDDDCHSRNEQNHLIECKPGEIGEFIGMILDLSGVSAGRFDGYTNTQATEAKILRDVFTEGDSYFRSGDLFTIDEDDYFYFVDRIGDTFRWKSENVSTTEVSAVLSSYADAEMINVYGAAVPEHEGRAGMAAIELKQGHDFNPTTFYALAVSQLPHYAVPQFIRVSQKSDITATFKLRKVELQKQGYDPKLVSDPLYLLDKAKETYTAYNSVLLESLGFKPFSS